MSLSAPRLQAAITSGIRAGLRSLYTLQNMRNPSNVGDPFYTVDQWATIIGNVTGAAVVLEITGNAQCNGLDSHLDSHNDVGII